MINFFDWCNTNNREDLLNRWDYDKNDVLPSEISMYSHKKYYFLCPRGIHESETFYINQLVKNTQSKLECRKCKSFAQFVIDKYGKDYLEKIWHPDNEKSPWDYGAQSKQKVKLICQDYYHDYYQSPDCVSQGHGCSICSNKTGNILLENSLGVLHPETINLWSIKNNTTPFDYSPMSGSKVFWKCENGKHADYAKKIYIANNNGFECPECKKENKQRKYEDLTGKRFGCLTVISYEEESSKLKNVSYWNCECNCGNRKVVRAAHLKNGSIVSCGDRFIHHSAQNNGNWKGGVTPDHIMFRNNSDYKDWRQKIYAYDRFSCVCCGSSNINKNAHHIINFSQNDELRYDIMNGITLCENCHSATIPGGFHYEYGTQNNTPEQLEQYINDKRKQLGIENSFNINDYLKMKEESINDS